MKIIDEFKAFAMRGNVIDLAVGVVIGGAFGKIVSSLVADIITPAVGIVVGGIDFTKLGYTMKNLKGEEVKIAYGNFLQTMFDFLIIAFAIFMVVKILNKAQEKVIKKQKEDAKKEEAKKSDEVLLLEEIRDLLSGSKKNTKVTPEKVIEKPVVEKVESKKVTPKKVITMKKTPVKKTVTSNPKVKK